MIVYFNDTNFLLDISMDLCTAMVVAGGSGNYKVHQK